MQRGGAIEISMASSPLSVRKSLLIVLALFLSSLFLSSAIEVPTLKGVDFLQPVVEVKPSPLSGPFAGRSSKEILCERVKVSGHSRLKLGSYANGLRVTVVPSVSVPERFHSRILVCFHRNTSLGFCECPKDDWKTIQKGIWSSVMSPYGNGYVDLKLTGEVAGPITISMDEEPQRWRLVCLALGFLLLLLAPIVSSWVPFYYSSSMAVGVLLVVLILLFQGMKLLPTARKNGLYLFLYGSVIGFGSFILHQLSNMVNAILVSFGLGEELHNLVSLSLLVGVILAGAGLGYWIVRKFVISEDGSVDAGVAQFVKWAMRVFAATLIMQSSLDALTAMGALILCLCICSLIMSPIWRDAEFGAYPLSWTPRWSRCPQTTRQNLRAEFLPRTPKRGSQGKPWNRQKKPAAWWDSSVKGTASPSTEVQRSDEDYYSVMHKTPKRKKYSEQEWQDSKAHWTKQAMVDLASSREFTDWMIEHADRIHVASPDSSDVADEADVSDSDSIEELTRSGPNMSGFSFW